MSRWKLAVALCCIAGSVAAADQGWYIGGSVGQSIAHYGSRDTMELGYGSDGHINNDDTGLKVYGGYMFNEHWGAEAAYQDLGYARFFGAVGQDKFGAKSYSLSLLGKLPLNKGFSVFGKAGAIAATTSYTCVMNCEGLINHEKNGVYANYGLGVQYEMTQRLALRAEYERFDGLKSATGASSFGGNQFKSDYELVSVGLQYQF